MPAGSWSLLIPLIILVIFSGFFSATETAFTCASKIKLKTLNTNGNKRAGKVLHFIENKLDKLINTVLIGNNIVNLSASAISTLFFAKILINAKIDSTVAATAVITVVVLIFGEIILPCHSVFLLDFKTIKFSFFWLELYNFKNFQDKI